MTPEAGYDRAKELFLAACELPPDQRRALLDRECGEDAALRARVQSLLALDSAATQHEDFSLRASSAYHRPLPERIGPYRITSVIGEGGMGTVYEAVQRRPQRRVALKVIRGLIASPQGMRRFEREVELLGRLRHPQMAQIYDAGVHLEQRPDDEAKTQADSKRERDPLAPSPRPIALPYFAMELVNGMPITDFAAKQNLSLEARLRLIIRLCDAVGYAHRKGVIHLDLKPGNILVDYAGHPKILDFGIARATEPEPPGADDPERPRAILGTVPYMSPEQIGGEPNEIDTRSDIYALGAVCYELIAGRTPHGAEEMNPREAVDYVLEHDPTPISEVADEPVPRDLERIIRKALHRSRDQRYQTTQEFARDLELFLARRPVSVTPHRGWYVARLFATRHRFVVAVGALALVSLTVLTAVLVNVSIRAGRLADEHRVIKEMVESLLLMADPPTDPEARMAQLAGWREQIGGKLDQADPLPALLDLAIGRALLELGREEQAQAVLVQAAERLVSMRGLTDPLTRQAAAAVVRCGERTGDAELTAHWRGIAEGPSPDVNPSR